MCGRYTLKARRETIAAAFDLADALELPPRYNIAPAQFVPAVRLDQESGSREMTLLQWGLVPSWEKEPGIGNSLINARSETVAEKPAFRSAFKKRRCLIPTTGFYEWMVVPGAKKKQPVHIRLIDGQPFALAGLWERWTGAEGAEVESCTIITT